MILHNIHSDELHEGSFSGRLALLRCRCGCCARHGARSGFRLPEHHARSMASTISETIDLAGASSTFVIHASGDNRYQLFVNGRRIVSGPARGDLFHWRYETVDAAPTAGRAQRVGGGGLEFRRPGAGGADHAGDGIPAGGRQRGRARADTGPGWKCVHNPAYSPSTVTAAEVRGYYVAGPATGWSGTISMGLGRRRLRRFRMAAGGQSSRWRRARGQRSAYALDAGAAAIPEEKRRSDCRSAAGQRRWHRPAVFPARPEPLHVPAGTARHAAARSDLSTTAYPELEVSGGRDAV